MENSEHPAMGIKDSPEALPSLISYISSNKLAGFDNVKEHSNPIDQHQPIDLNSFISSTTGIEASIGQGQIPLSQSQRMHSVSISMPSSPLQLHLPNPKKVFFRGDDEIISNNEITEPSATAKNGGPVLPKFYSQPMPTGYLVDGVVASGKYPNHSSEAPPRHPRVAKLKDKRYDSFKTFSGKLERQLSHLRGKQLEDGPVSKSSHSIELENMPVDRFFDALQGPELDTLRDSEEILLPEDKQWPFLLRYPISSFGICLGISSQAIMWKTVATASSMKFLNLSLHINLVLWCISVCLTAIVFFMYTLKVVFYFEAVRREYYHPIRVNFFFAPWIALLFLAIGAPPSFAKDLHASLWYILMTPIFILELKIYGQWMSGGQRRLSKVANPSNHLSVVGNFVGALLGASMGLKEGPIFFFAVGLAHYTVLFVTLYQRLPTNETLPKELHPVFFLFVAAPSVASMAWARIQGSFDYGSRIAYFIAMFLYFSLAVRVNFFRGFRFSLAWWAYTFPMTGAAIATVKYTDEVTNVVTKTLSLILCAISTLIITYLLATTIVHAFVLGDLFPNDIAIAISKKRSKTSRKWFHRRNGSSDANAIENFLKFADSDQKDVEGSSTTKEVQTSPPIEVCNSLPQIHNV